MCVCVCVCVCVCLCLCVCERERESRHLIWLMYKMCSFGVNLLLVLSVSLSQPVGVFLCRSVLICPDSFQHTMFIMSRRELSTQD